MMTDPWSGVMQMYSGLNKGGAGGAQQALGGAANLAGSASGLDPNFGMAGNAIGEGGNALGIYNGIQQGGVRGALSAGANAAQLAGRTGMMPSGGSGIANDLSSALGIYNGIQRGGPLGYGGAAINAAKLGSNLGAFGGASGAIGTAAGYAAAPLALYNEINNWESGNTGSDALGGAETGAAIGSIVPGIGTVIGGLLGGAAGAISSAFGNGRVDPENASWNGYTNAYKQNPNVASQVSNPYLSLAGLFDLRGNQVKGQIPFYSKYGRMGEQQFTTDMTGQINSALQKGTISKDSTPDEIMSKVVNPWIGSMGTWNDSNKSAQEDLLKQMVSQYTNGSYAQDWKAIGGDTPFSGLQGFGAAASSAPAAPRAAPGRTMTSARRFDDGGYVDPGTGGGTINFQDGSGTDPSFIDPGTGGGTVNFGDTPTFDPSTQYYGQTPSGGGAVSGGGASSSPSHGNILSGIPGLGSLLGGLSNQQLLGLLAGGASLAGAASNPTLGYHPQPPPMFGANNALNPHNSFGNFTTTPRTRTNPNINYANYGAGPAANFYSSSATAPTAHTAPQAQGPNNLTLSQILQALGSMHAPAAPRIGLATHAMGGPHFYQGMPQRPMMPQPMMPSPLMPQNPHMMMAAGGHSPLLVGHQMNQADNPNRHVKGPGDGTSDEINAKLSDGEYVFTAQDVALLGNGSNDAGARALDGLRQRLRQHAGKKLVNGEQFMKAKKPEGYLKGDQS